MRDRLVAPPRSSFWRVLLAALAVLLAVAGVALPSSAATGAHTGGIPHRNQAGTLAAAARTDAVVRDAAVTANVVPNAPTGVTGVPGNATVAVSWVAPVPNGGTAVTRYTVTSSPSSRRCTSTSATTCTVTGLVNGTAYTFTVVARNTAGNSVASAPSSPVTPRTVPGAPTGVSATAGNAAAEVSWSAPASNGGAAITGYTATSSPDGRTCASSGATTCAVAGLTNGTEYTFRVVATNAAGSSAASSPSGPVVPLAVPDPPTDVSAVAGNGSADVSWSAPASSGSAPISEYTATSSPDGRTCTSSAPSTSCTVTGLTNGTAYTFRATARSAAGTSEASAESGEVTPDVLPDAPAGVNAVPGNREAAVSWTAPATNGGSAIIGYTVSASPGDQVCTTTGDTACTVSGLDNGTAYSFSVVARNQMGAGPASSASESVVPRTVPDAPTGVTATAGNASADVSWTAPDSDGGAEITGYTATSSPEGRTCTGSAPATSCTVTGLVNGAAYSFRVTAQSAAGTSD